MLTDPTIEVWSKAGCSTCIYVHYSKKLKLLFDIGRVELESFTEEIFACKHVFISHGHLDHSGAAFSHARQRSLRHPESPAKYYVPVEIVKQFEEAKQKMESINGEEISMEIIGVRPGDEIEIDNCSGNNMDLFVRAFASKHRVPCVGYELWRRKLELKEELKSLSRSDRAYLFRSKSREEIQACYIESKFIDITYTGDSLFESILDRLSSNNNPVRTLVIECTFLGLRNRSDDVAVAHERSHVHLDEIIANKEAFKNCENIVFVHMSNRYGIQSIISGFASKLPQVLIKRVIPALDAFAVRKLTQRSYDAAKSFIQSTSNTAVLCESWASCIAWEAKTCVQNATVTLTVAEIQQQIGILLVESRWSEILFYRIWLLFYCLEHIDSNIETFGLAIPSTKIELSDPDSKDAKLSLTRPLLHGSSNGGIACCIHLFSRASLTKSPQTKTNHLFSSSTLLNATIMNN